MPTTLSLAEQERLDAIKRKQQLEKLYQKYGADKAETPAEQAPDIPWYKRAASAVTGGLEQMGNAEPKTVEAEPIKKKKKKLSNEDALKLDTQGGQIEYLNQEG
jgi:hypothetical protein